MRRRLSLALILVLVVLAVVGSNYYRSLRSRGAHRIATAGASRDSLARLDSAARADAREAIDTMCFASRFGIPCDPR